MGADGERTHKKLRFLVAFLRYFGERGGGGGGRPQKKKGGGGGGGGGERPHKKIRSEGERCGADKERLGRKKKCFKYIV